MAKNENGQLSKKLQVLQKQANGLTEQLGLKGKEVDAWKKSHAEISEKCRQLESGIETMKTEIELLKESRSAILLECADQKDAVVDAGLAGMVEKYTAVSEGTQKLLAVLEDEYYGFTAQGKEVIRLRLGGK
jgi:archaellum component FlaC